MTHDSDYTDYPPGLDREILRILQPCVGQEQAMPRTRLFALLRSMPRYRMLKDRDMRECINQLRKAEHMICSIGGKGGGYWMAANWTELKTFTGKQLHGRAMDLLEQEKALRQAGVRRWGPEQLSLFGGS